MKTSEKITLEKGMYIFGIIAIIIGIPILYFYMKAFSKGDLPVCMVYQYFGIYCPGCGGSRAVKALLEGKILESFCDHPIVLYTVVIYFVFMISQTLHFINPVKVKGIRFHYWFLYGALVVIVLNVLVKNVLKFCFGIYLL
ncbi:MAG TPA: DUF2752 domain-containing protein [Lachnospiraceae bacterium]|nr:DUF2752 domain-containing protein [Lachnospiraceae bacterium]